MIVQFAVAVVTAFWLWGESPSATPRAPVQAEVQRVRMNLNDGWRYASGAIEGAEHFAFVDSGWDRVTLPHTWNAQDGFT
ncbi:MAG: hypothetical protein ABIW79_11430 [Gemmatimonas sp.]